MTATRQPRPSITRRAFGALRRLNDELLASGEAMARSARAPQQQDPESATSGSPASADKVPTGA